MQGLPSPPEIRRARALAAGYAAGMALAGLASWLRVAWEGTLRIDTGRPSFFVASALAGVGLAVASLCAVRLVEVAEHVPRERLLRWAMAAGAASVFAAPLTSSDLFHYLVTGRLQALGLNPFAVPLGDVDAGALTALAAPRWLRDTTSYGPLANLALRAAAEAGDLVGSPAWGAAVAFKLMMAACAAAFTALAARWLRAHRPEKEGARTLALVAFCPPIAWEITAQAHNDGILLVALAIFVAAALDGRDLTATLAIAAGTYAKITLAPILAIYLVFLLRRRGPRALLHVLAAAALGAALMLPFLRGLHGLGPTLAAIRGASQSHSLGDFFYNVLAPAGPAAQAQAVNASFVLCLAVCGVAFAHALRARAAPEMLRGAWVFLLAWDLTIPTFQPWYVCWLFPFAVVETDARWRRLIGVYGVWTVLQWAAPIDPFTTMAVNAYVIWRVAKLGAFRWHPADAS